MTSHFIADCLTFPWPCRLLNVLLAVSHLSYMIEVLKWPSKSALLIFTRRVNFAEHFITLNETEIFPSTTHRFLRVIIKPCLLGHLYTRYLISRCGKLANLLKFLRGTWWGSNPNSLLIIFKTIIREMTDYASFLFPYYNAGLSESLERILRKALRFYTGLRRSTPCNVVYVESGIAPLRFNLIYWQKTLFLSLLPPNLIF